MASPSGAPTLAERADIHKSCKSIETLLNVLNEYCEAVGAVVALQKKLSKALKETANLKVTGEIASNAMLASANIFESLSDTDIKFSKIMDKEYDLVSGEVKKWFKKLAKEEKLHDERLSTANAKIKQAGQTYEKKSKKKTSDATEEHARYINLISTLGPEISQEKYNHALNVSQRHTNTTYSVASCLARLADFEWQRSCECVRRFSPTIGPLVNYKSLCEGGWTGSIPADLPDITSANGTSTPQTERNPGLKTIEEDTRQPAPASARITPEPSSSPEQSRVPLPAYSAQQPPPSPDPSRADNSVRNSPTLTRQAPAHTSTAQSSVPPTPTAEALELPRAPYVDANTGSVRSLSAFPAPPTHFPIPAVRQTPQRQQSGLSQSGYSSTSHLEFPTGTRQLAESPVSAHDELPPSIVNDHDISSRTGHRDLSRNSGNSGGTQNSMPPSPEQKFNQTPTIPEGYEPEHEENQPITPVTPVLANEMRPAPLRSQTSLPQDSAYRSAPPGHRSLSSVDIKPLNTKSYRDDYRDSTNKEFGVLGNTAPTPTKSRTIDNYKYSRQVERTDTGTSTAGSIVAAMRNRYDANSGSTSPTPRELPRLPLSVGDMAQRYQGGDGPVSPRARAVSPPVSRQQSLPLLEAAARQAQDSYRQGLTSPDEERRKRQRQDEQAEMQRRQKEQELKDRELELEMRSRELERDRLRLLTMREGGQDQRYGEIGYTREGSAGGANMQQQQQRGDQGQFGVRPRERRVSLRHQLQRPLSQMDLDENGEHIGPPQQMNRIPSHQQQQQQRPRPQQQDSYGSREQQQQLLVPPSPGQNMHTPPATLYSPKPSHPPSPLLQVEELEYEDSPSSRYRDEGGSRSNSNSNTNTHSTDTSTHAPYCGCETCSASKYRSSGAGPPEPRQRTTSQYSQQESTKGLRSEKSKLGTGWIKRLSMPVGNAFSSDSKKHQSNNSLGGGGGNYSLGSGVSGGPTKSSGLFSLDGKRNSSTTALGVQEDGKLSRPSPGQAHGRRSYDVSGVSNRSMTNLGLRQ